MLDILTQGNGPSMMNLLPGRDIGNDSWDWADVGRRRRGNCTAGKGLGLEDLDELVWLEHDGGGGE